MFGCVACSEAVGWSSTPSQEEGKAQVVFGGAGGDFPLPFKAQPTGNLFVMGP